MALFLLLFGRCIQPRVSKNRLPFAACVGKFVNSDVHLTKLGMKNFLKSGLLLATLLVGALTIKAQSGITFHQGTFAEAIAKASKENKLVFMDAYTSWCGPCRAMAANTFTNPDVGEYFNKNFVNVKMDMENGEGPNLARKYAVMAYPTLLFIGANGQVVHKELGFKDATTFMTIGKKAAGMRPGATTN